VTKTSRKIRPLLAAALALAAAGASAQPAWTVRTADSTFAVPASGDPAAAALGALHARGHLGARVDSLRGDTLWATPGPLTALASVETVGASALRDPAGAWATRPGRPYRPAALDADLRATATAYARLGYADAVLVPEVTVGDDGVVVTVRIDEGAPGRLAGVELVGGRSRARAFAGRVTGVEPGAEVGDVDAERVRQSLDATGLYATVGTPTLARDADGRLVLQVPVREAPPGAFDLVLGFLPPAEGAAGQLVGSGRLNLRNLFGGGRALDVELVRNPGLASSFRLAARDPFVLGLPIGAGVVFEGVSRDSTFSRQSLGAEVSYPVGGGLSVVGLVRRESVRPGVFGAREVGGRPRVARQDALYAGLGLVLRRVDRVANPRRGLALAVSVEQGRPRRAALDAAPALDVRPTYRRLEAEARGYLPTLGRQAAVLGLDAHVLSATTGAVLDEGELYRFGGAQSLRGYTEEAVLGRAVGRVLAEYRLLLDAESFAATFVDLGFVDRPDLPGLAAERRLLPGYGVGARVRTGVGLVQVSYALNPDLPLGRGRVHIGLGVGL
jgi:outer membrane protein assembly factor BamA